MKAKRRVLEGLGVGNGRGDWRNTDLAVGEALYDDDTFRKEAMQHPVGLRLDDNVAVERVVPDPPIEYQAGDEALPRMFGFVDARAEILWRVVRSDRDRTAEEDRTLVVLLGDEVH